MKKKLKKIQEKFIKFLMLFMMCFSSVQEPIMVFAAEEESTPAVGALKLGQNGPISETGSVSTKATSSDGKVDVTKTVTADPNNEGKYHVEFNIKGKSTQEKNPVYVVIVFDRSGSMCNKDFGICWNMDKWNNAVSGAKSLTTKVTTAISTAQVALVTFGDNATKERGFSRNTLTDSNFGYPDGATNLHDGLIKAKTNFNDLMNNVIQKRKLNLKISMVNFYQIRC